MPNKIQCATFLKFMVWSGLVASLASAMVAESTHKDSMCESRAQLTGRYAGYAAILALLVMFVGMYTVTKDVGLINT